MRLATEWDDDIRQDPGLASDLIRLFEKIQIDAAQAGMRVASGILMGMPTDRFKPQSVRDVEIAELIQHRANNLTIEEL